MVGGMVPHLLGLPLGSTAADWHQTSYLAPVIALVALGLALKAPAWTRRIPPYLTGLLAATAAASSAVGDAAGLCARSAVWGAAVRSGPGST